MFNTLIAPYAKAFIPVIVGLILLLLSYVGIAETMTVGEAVELLVITSLASLGVYAVPNAPMPEHNIYK